MKDMTESELDARHAEKMRKKKAARDKILATKTIEKGLLIVHTGKGKGKSTAAIGMIFRALGHGMPVAIVQFVKGKWQTGERVALEKFGDLVSINTMGEGFTWETQDRQRDLSAARAALERAKAIIGGQAQGRLLDEINACSVTTYADRRSSCFCATKSPPTFTSLTGRNAPRAH
jgi:cob(I)alamin adenosyltransferase